MPYLRLFSLGLGLSLSWLLFTASSFGQVIDFEDVAQPSGGGAGPLDPVDSQGYRLTDIGPGGFTGLENDADGAFNGTTVYFGRDTVTVTNLAGDAFDLIAFDAGEEFAGAGGIPTSVDVIGTYVGGGTTTQSFNIDGLFDGTGGIDDYETFVLDSSFTNLQSAQFDFQPAGDQGFQLDNIQVRPAAVPEPASIAIWSLIGLTLAGFGYTRIRRKK